MLSSLTSLVSPLGFCVALLFAAVCFARSTSTLRIACVSTLLILVVFSLPYTSKALIYTLEKRSAQRAITDIPPADLAILLGGGIKVPYGYRLRPELAQWGDRLAFTAELYAAGKVSQILISGGNDYQSTTGLTESELTKNFLVQWGVNAADILVETKSTSTFQNAAYSAPIIKALNPKSIYLISSAFHLPRSHALYCAEGIVTEALPSNHLSSGAPNAANTNWVPLASSLHNSTIASKEYFAMLYYAIIGKIPLSKLWGSISCTPK